ncbi:amidohydrolase family protein [Mesorhizobium sp. 1B3]|uniref:amidohydrolase family protein n=1 Tax=Mesorhizobium sp. 1B3 TaxID=3243599 RepID=UPI003D96DA40
MGAPQEIIETHVHFMAPGRFHYPWLARRPDVDGPFTDADYRIHIEGANVTKVVLVEAAARDDQSFDEAEWLASFADATPNVAAVVAQARIERGAAVADELDRLAQIGLIRGIRRVVRPPFQSDPDFCVRPAFIDGIRLLERYGWSFDVACGPADLANVMTLADRCPAVTLVIDHMANPPLDGEAHTFWEQSMRAVAERENVVCKISGLPVHLPADWGAETVAPIVEKVAEAFGPRRILFGSDTPVQMTGGGFPRWYRAMETIFARSGEDERELFFGGNAGRVYGL